MILMRIKVHNTIKLYSKYTVFLKNLKYFYIFKKNLLIKKRNYKKDEKSFIDPFQLKSLDPLRGLLQQFFYQEDY